MPIVRQNGPFQRISKLGKFLIKGDGELIRLIEVGMLGFFLGSHSPVRAALGFYYLLARRLLFFLYSLSLRFREAFLDGEQEGQFGSNKIRQRYENLSLRSKILPWSCRKHGRRRGRGAVSILFVRFIFSAIIKLV